MSRINLSVNARFLSRPATGVDRVAIELITALAKRSDIGHLALLHPKCRTLFSDWISALPPSLQIKISLTAVGNRQGHIWEQIELPLAILHPELRSRPLLSLCSTGPVLARNQTLMIHDAQVWDVPQSYTRSFRMGYRTLLPILGHTVRNVLTVSNFSANRLTAVGITRPGKARVIFNGGEHILRKASDLTAFKRYGIEPKGYILAIGSLAPHKNLQLLVEAAVARGSGVPPLVMIGSMNTKIFAGASLPQGDGLRYIGRVNDGELRALYEGALALAFPSLTEGFGLPPIEAMLCNCPVVATTGGAVPEVCGDAALLVDPNDRAAWTEALNQIAIDESLRRDLTEKGSTRANGMTWDIAAEEIRLMLVPTKKRKTAS